MKEGEENGGIGERETKETLDMRYGAELFIRQFLSVLLLVFKYRRGRKC